MTICKYIAILEKIIKEENDSDAQKMNVLENIKKLLTKVDYESEEILLTSEEKFIELLASLKEEPLTFFEKEMATQIVSIKKIIS